MNKEKMELLPLLFAGIAAIVTAVLNLDSLYSGTRSRKKQAQVDLMGKSGVRAMVFIIGLLVTVYCLYALFIQ